MIIDNKVVAAGSAYGDIVNKNANEVLVEVSKGHWMKPNEDTVAMIGAKEYCPLQLSLIHIFSAAADAGHAGSTSEGLVEVSERT